MKTQSNASGKLRQRITIERLTKTKGTNGVTKRTYMPLKTIWASANGLYGKEYWQAKEYGGEDTVQFVFRYAACKDLSKELDRIVFRDVVYNIISIDNINFQNTFWKVKATASIPQSGV